NHSKPYLKPSDDHFASNSHLPTPHVRFFFQNLKFCDLVIFSQQSKSKKGYRSENGSADLICLFSNRIYGMI
ncbi:MAG: hypothetical protein WAM61_07215, partial [Desulfobacterales bacterium]